MTDEPATQQLSKLSRSSNWSDFNDRANLKRLEIIFPQCSLEQFTTLLQKSPGVSSIVLSIRGIYTEKEWDGESEKLPEWVTLLTLPYLNYAKAIKQSFTNLKRNFRSRLCADKRWRWKGKRQSLILIVLQSASGISRTTILANSFRANKKFYLPQYIFALIEMVFKNNPKNSPFESSQSLMIVTLHDWEQ